MHELTHVWQFHRGDSVKPRSIYAQQVGAGYKFTRGQPWEEYNVEQQAHIVETWNEERKGRGENGRPLSLHPLHHTREGQWQLPIEEYWVEAARRAAAHA